MIVHADIDTELLPILDQVSDPEIPVLTILDMGVVRYAKLVDDEVKIKLTPTYSGCPAMDVIGDDIKIALKEAGYESKIDLIDTAGIEDLSSDNISRITKLSSIKAIDKANILLFVIDARANLTSDDLSLASLIRKSGKKVILIANKCEGVAVKQGEIDSLSLGFGNPILISSEHNLGIGELMVTVEYDFYN